MWSPHLQTPRVDTHDSSEGGYLASASDLMIGLLFVFIILVVVLALEQQKRAVEQQNITSELQRAIVENRARILAAQAAANAIGDPRGQVTASIGEQLKAVLPNIQIDAASGVVSLPDDVLFDLGRADLSSRGQNMLQNAAAQLVKVLPCYLPSQRTDDQCAANVGNHAIETIFIEGHTDNIPLVRGGYDNTNLSLDRARSVHQAMVQRGPLSTYKNGANQPLFSISAYGDSRPLKDISPSDERNRRVDLRIVMAYRPPNIQVFDDLLNSRGN